MPSRPPDPMTDDERAGEREPREARDGGAGSRAATPAERRQAPQEGPRLRRQEDRLRDEIRSELHVDAPTAVAEAEEELRSDVPVIQLDHISLAFDEPVLEDVSLEV